MTTRYRILDSRGRRYLDLDNIGTVLPTGEVTTTALRESHLDRHAGICAFVMDTYRQGGIAVHVSERDERFNDVGGWVGYTIIREAAVKWDEEVGYGRLPDG